MSKAGIIATMLGAWFSSVIAILWFDQLRPSYSPPAPAEELQVKEEVAPKKPTVFRIDGDGVPVYILAYTPFEGVWCFSVKAGTSCISGYFGNPREAVYQEP